MAIEPRPGEPGGGREAGDGGAAAAGPVPGAAAPQPTGPGPMWQPPGAGRIPAARSGGAPGAGPDPLDPAGLRASDFPGELPQGASPDARAYGEFPAYGESAAPSSRELVAPAYGAAAFGSVGLTETAFASEPLDRPAVVGPRPSPDGLGATTPGPGAAGASGAAGVGSAPAPFAAASSLASFVAPAGASTAAVSGVAAETPAADSATASPAADGGSGVHGPAGADGADGSDGSRGATSHRARRSPREQTGRALAVLGWLAAAFLIAHRFVPAVDGLLELAETWLPWLAVPVALLLIGALATRRLHAIIATVLAAAVWAAGYGPQLLISRGGTVVAGDVSVFTEDVTGSSAGELAAAGAAAEHAGATLVALEGLNAGLPGSAAVAALNAAYPYHVTEFEFGLWSRYPLGTAQAITLGTAPAAVAPGLAAASTPQAVIGAISVPVTVRSGVTVDVYVIHLPQAILGSAGFARSRDAALTRLSADLAADRADRVLVAGDFNTAQTDRAFGTLLSAGRLTSVQEAAGAGFGFDWPARFPVVRLDDVLERGGTAVRSVVLAPLAGGSGHRPILAAVRF